MKLKNVNYTAINVLFLEDVDINNAFVSNKTFPWEKNYKYFIGYFYDNYKIKPWHKILPKTSRYIKSYDVQTKLMYFLIEDDDLLKKYNTVWNKIQQ